MTLFTGIRAAAIGISAMGLSACAYTGGTGYYDDDGYQYGYNDPYCDSYYEYDRYYDCDYRSGFANIGYGGGYYDNFYYPGYGIYIFDRGGQRYRWQDRHRRYWTQQRYRWHAERRGHGHRGDAYRGEHRDHRDGRRTRRDHRSDNGVDATAGRIIDRAQRREEGRGTDGIGNGRRGERAGTRQVRGDAARGGRRDSSAAQPPRGRRVATPPVQNRQSAAPAPSPAPQAAPSPQRKSSSQPKRSKGRGGGKVDRRVRPD